MIEPQSVYDDHIGRIYKFDTQQYYSVTTMLSNTADKYAITRWKKKIGEEAAEKIVRKAGRFGTDFHTLGEHFLKGLPLPKVTTTPTTIFKEISPILTAHISKVIAVESVVITNKFQLAGRCDAIVEWDGRLAVLDFKLLNDSNSKWLTDYWIQTSIYAQAWGEMTGCTPEYLVLVIGDKILLKGLYYKSIPKQWLPYAYKRVKEFQASLYN